MDVDPATQRGETSRGAARGPDYHPSGLRLDTIDEEDLLENGTPPGTPFDSDYPPQQTGGSIPTEPYARVPTENFFTPLSTESQETAHTSVNNAQPPAATGTLDVRPAAAAAQGATQADILAPPAAPATAETAATAAMETDETNLTPEETIRALADHTTRLEAERAAAAEAALLAAS
jgi:hypothetical protein